MSHDKIVQTNRIIVSHNGNYYNVSINQNVQNEWIKEFSVKNSMFHVKMYKN